MNELGHTDALGVTAENVAEETLAHDIPQGHVVAIPVAIVVHRHQTVVGPARIQYAA